MRGAALPPFVRGGRGSGGSLKGACGGRMLCDLISREISARASVERGGGGRKGSRRRGRRRRWWWRWDAEVVGDSSSGIDGGSGVIMAKTSPQRRAGAKERPPAANDRDAPLAAPPPTPPRDTKTQKKDPTNTTTIPTAASYVDYGCQTLFPRRDFFCLLQLLPSPLRLPRCPSRTPQLLVVPLPPPAALCSPCSLLSSSQRRPS